nr:NADH-plastoquinone oxidoreductase subunit 4L [Platycodon grandiflorus]WCD61575.1 NADH-plastoquinone oxidoreductase subunit 4L [Platycodon grandiflorus]
MMLEHVLLLSAYLFSVGLYGLITSRNMVRALMCLELILNGVNINFVTFSDEKIQIRCYSHYYA